jgi:hypothetical protein
MYLTKNSGALAFLVYLDLLSIEDIQITTNRDGFIVGGFEPTEDRLAAYRLYTNSFINREELVVDIVHYNSVFGKLKRRMDEYKRANGLK